MVECGELISLYTSFVIFCNLIKTMRTCSGLMIFYINYCFIVSLMLIGIKIVVHWAELKYFFVMDGCLGWTC